MNEEPVQAIRETTRNLLVLNRRKNRDEEADFNRSIADLRIDQSTILSIVNKLKTKSSVSLSQLQILKNALIDDVANIELVLNTHGALRGLVRELTGNEVNKQCAAAGCCCNLALGDSRAGVAVAKAAGPYLVSALDNLTMELAITCAWTLGNLAGSGHKACELLTSQGSITKLIELLGSNNEEIKDAAMYALVRFAHQLKDDLKTEHLQKTFEILPHLVINTTPQLLFILSCHSGFCISLLTEQLVEKLLQFLVICIRNSDEDNITYIFRFLANVNCKEIYEVLLSFILEHNMIQVVKTLLVNESVLWCLGNMYGLCPTNVFFEML